MKKLILLIALVVFLSGCVQQGTITQYKNDVITLEDYLISERSPYASSPVTIEFSVQNNGENAVDRVEVSFFDIPGFKFIGLDCQGIKSTDRKCVFEGNNKIESLDSKRVVLTLQTPPVKSEISYTVSYYINYSYSGYRKATIPIIDGTTRKEPIAKYSQSSPSYSPIQLEFQAPIGRETKKGDQVVREYWGVKDKVFEVKMDFKDVGSSSIGKIQPVNIAQGNVKLKLYGIIPATFGDVQLPCDFNTAGDKLVSKKTTKVPNTLKCNFKSIDFTQPELFATIHTDFSYTYQFTRSEDFKIRPVEASE